MPTDTTIPWRTGEYYKAFGLKVADGMAMIERELAEARAHWLREQGFQNLNSPDLPLAPGEIGTAGFADQIRTLTAWPPWHSSFRHVVAICPLSCCPELKDALAPEECLQRDGEPWLCLGETDVANIESHPGFLSDAYVARRSYWKESVVIWTTHLREQQVEEEYRQRGPGARHRELEQKIAALKGEGKWTVGR
jgi:hypothetical protein